MADQKMKGRRRRMPLMILVFVFHVLSSMGVHGRPSTVIYPVTGDIYQHGAYFVRLKIGNPPKVFELHIDTGVALSWVQCQWPDLSIGLTMPPHNLYQPVEGNFLPCTSPIFSEAICQQEDNKCFYPMLYGDISFAHVIMVSDYIFHTPRLAFGCAYHIGSYSPDPYAILEGSLGLGKGKEGILSQLTAMGLIRNMTGHCFERQGGGGGYLFLGDELVRVNEMTWTPMAYYHFRYYYVGPAELFYDRISTGVKNLRVLFDSGTTLTQLNSEAFAQVYNRILYDEYPTRTQVLQMVKADGSSICWNRIDGIPIQAVHQDVRQVFKTISLKFPEQAFLDLRPEDYLIPNEQGNICLGIERNSQDDGSIIGVISMHDKLIVYDNENERIGWSSADCTFKKEWSTNHKRIIL